jgi:hypothetical protein
MSKDDKRNEAIKKAITEYSKKALVSKETARASLIASGIYNESGKLNPEYGG